MKLKALTSMLVDDVMHLQGSVFTVHADKAAYLIAKGFAKAHQETAPVVAPAKPKRAKATK